MSPVFLMLSNGSCGQQQERQHASSMRIFFLPAMLCLLAHCSPVPRVPEVSPLVEKEKQMLTEEPQQHSPPRTPEEQLEVFNLLLDQG